MRGLRCEALAPVPALIQVAQIRDAWIVGLVGAVGREGAS